MHTQERICENASPLFLSFGLTRSCPSSIIEDMEYIELTVHTTTEASELVADAMWEHTPFGVTVCDKNDFAALARDSSVFWDYTDDALLRTDGEEALVKCYFEPDSAEAEIRVLLSEIETRRALSGGAIAFGSLEATRRTVEGDDWIDVWKKHFRPQKKGNVVIVPAWIPYEPQEGECVVLLDSDMAFGTGEHETTSMCIELAQDWLRAGDCVLDVGCGSGILGICALKLGAKEAVLSDLDPVAVRAAQLNCERNGVSDRARVLLADLLTESSVRADLVFANITAEILKRLAPALPAHLNRGGRVILSGILNDRVEGVEAAFSAAGLRVAARRDRGEWVSLVLEGGD